MPWHGVHEPAGRYQEGVDQLKRAAQMDPTSEGAYRGLASAYESAWANYPEAARDLPSCNTPPGGIFMARQFLFPPGPDIPKPLVSLASPSR